MAAQMQNHRESVLPQDKEGSDRLFVRVFVPAAIASLLIVGVGIALVIAGLYH